MEVNSTWLITSELANQRARKVLFTCVVYTNSQHLPTFGLRSIQSVGGGRPPESWTLSPVFCPPSNRKLASQVDNRIRKLECQKKLIYVLGAVSKGWLMMMMMMMMMVKRVRGCWNHSLIIS